MKITGLHHMQQDYIICKRKSVVIRRKLNPEDLATFFLPFSIHKISEQSQ